MMLFGRAYNWLFLALIACLCIVGTILTYGSFKPKEKVDNHSDFSAVGLVYHRFGDARHPSTNTPVSDFEWQISYLKEKQFLFSTASQVNRNVQQYPGKKQVVITVDDGYKSFYAHGLPVLKKYEVPATLFINTESVGWKDYLGWEQIKEVAESGIEIGHHSHSHAYFMNLPAAERADKFEEDLLRANVLFEKHLGFVPKVYSYPFGEYDHALINILKKNGFEIAFAQNSGVWSDEWNQFGIPRFPVSSMKPDRFKSKVNMKAMPLKNGSVTPLIVEGGQEVNFEWEIGDESIGALNCFLAGEYRSDIFSRKDSLIRVSFKAPNGRRRTLLTFTARDDKGQWYWWSRLLVNPDIKE